MNGNSKREKLAYIIGRSVRRALHDIAWESPGDAEHCRRLADRIVANVEYEMTGATPYSMREIQDVMEWKKVKE